MQNDKLKNYLHLHVIVFIWGFTAVLGKLITINALSLVWYRMGMAAVLIFLFIVFKGIRMQWNGKLWGTMGVAGLIIALHWLTFFEAIKVSNVSIALATMATGALFAAVLEPIWYKRKLIGYEIVFGLIVMGALFLIFKVETQYAYGILLALVSAFLAAVFSLINGKLIHQERPSIIALFEMSSGMCVLSIVLAFQNRFSADFFTLTMSDWTFIFLLASICTAYAFIASVKIMRFISPYTVMLTTNLEPVYGIVLAFLILGDSEKMNPLFYIGALVILTTVVASGIIKNRSRLKKPLVTKGSA
ncbi:DMT family transporter [Arenibacter sp. GZD96]|uniref:DMT family transporter n=1 Tax=Aurantibrevibacter litoralis TaxID=3106030 RepID=UPI002AFFAAE8|nr:DMT family transporter [Arenibacter sp. GZD-96]MEA1785426.1 DMT family transporter [Arenibacter sp. GZD-96]